ncbi:NAD(P)-binding protein [Ophiobolus disseminans]|uniref:NAD(P)-binding protein n=1 Tax=Ophiobolus disseminans TaxID=1469910 RepID=A0A6A7A0L9_9PLEO|nr:NAD(P)-binding protein [Ophiobolus disseminans]
MQTVLIVGATGNIGASAIHAALRSNLHVLAIVRNQASAEKLFANVGTREDITTVEADITSDRGVKDVVEKVWKGELPAFQHVYAAAGGLFDTTSILDLTMEDVRKHMRVNFEPNLFAYQATIPYLLKQNDPTSTWTLCTGASGDNGGRAAASMTQGALYSLANVACLDNADTNVRFNEIYLGLFVIAGAAAEQFGAMEASEFAIVYEKILARPDIKGCRMMVCQREDLTDLRFSEKLE